MTKETVKDYGVRLEASAFDIVDNDAPEYVVVPVGSLEDAKFFAFVMTGGKGKIGYYEYDLEDGFYVGDVYGNDLVRAYGPGDGLREIPMPEEAADDDLTVTG